MKKRGLSSTIGVIISILSVILAISSIALSMKVMDQVTAQLDDVQKTTNLLENRVDSLDKTLQQQTYKISDIEHSIENLSDDIDDLNNELYNLQDQIDYLKGNLSLLQTSIGFVFDWIDSSNIPSSFEYKVRQCYSNGILKTACLAFYLDHFEGIQYQEDISEHIKSPQEFLQTKSGDCEDYAWFFTMFIQQLKDEGKIKQIELPYDVLISFDEYIVYSEPDGDWYYENVDYDRIDISNLTPYMVCYKVYDQDVGHCITALCPELNLSQWDLGIIGNCYLLEPQDGFKLFPTLCWDYTPLAENNYELVGCNDYGPHNLEYIYIVMGKDIICTLDEQWICIRR